MNNFARIIMFIGLGGNIVSAIAQLQILFASGLPITAAALGESVKPVIQALGGILPHNAHISDALVDRILDVTAVVLNDYFKPKPVVTFAGVSSDGPVTVTT